MLKQKGTKADNTNECEIKFQSYAKRTIVNYIERAHAAK